MKKERCQQYHLVHGVIGIVVLCVGAPNPGRFQQVFLFFLVIALLLHFFSLPVPFPLSLPLSVSVAEGFIRVSAPYGGEAALSAQPRGALWPPVPLLLPATTFPVSARWPATYEKEKSTWDMRINLSWGLMFTLAHYIKENILILKY